MEFKYGIISLDSCLKSHVYIVPIDDGYIMIDSSLPGYGPEIVKELEELKIPLNKIKAILITHCDYDHIGGLAYLKTIMTCPIYASKEEIDNMLGKTKILIESGVLPS
jgi:glyoxylase-like metal-dependent hydrolase (beta-lactamase superfamily II)